MASGSGLALICGGVIFLALVWGAFLSWRERERRAGSVLLLMALILPVPYLAAGLSSGPRGPLVSWILLGATLCLALTLGLPIRGRGRFRWGTPHAGVDERDIMFSRAALEPGTDRFRAYYSSRPQHRTSDDGFRREPGLLAIGSAQFHSKAFAAADAAFWTVERLRPYVGGGAGHSVAGYGVDVESGAAGGGGAAPGPTTRFLKAWSLKLGAHSVGVCELRDYHVYTHVGRGPEYGAPVHMDHRFALALTVEMDKEMVDTAPRSPTVMESAHQYLRSGVMAVQLADTIRRLGFDARAHIDGNYRVICPLVARDAGLGELGRMGLLMTPDLGPRVRIAVVTTDLPLVPDSCVPEPSVIDFCLHCRKCAECCPSRAISFLDPQEDEDGVLRWRIDPDACFGLWAKLGTDCARCMAVCPYSHPNNAIHGLVRRGIRNNVFFRRCAVWMDDLIYGRHPVATDLPDWLG